MNEEFENRLRRVMRPVAAPDGFAERVMRALPPRQAPANVVPLRIASPAPVSTWRRLSVPAALAASLLVAVFSGQHVGRTRTAGRPRCQPRAHAGATPDEPETGSCL